LPVFAVGFALPFAKRGVCASCKNAQHLSCQPSRKVFPRKLSARLSHCLFLRANRPAIASGFSRRDYLPPIGKRNLTPTSRNVQLSTIAVYIRLLYSATQHQLLKQARQRKAPTPPRTTQDGAHPLPSPPHRERGRQAAAPHATRGRGRGDLAQRRRVKKRPRGFLNFKFLNQNLNSQIKIKN
jgi:hypothetical protein